MSTLKNSIYKIQIDDITIRCYEKKDALQLKEAIDNSLEHLHEFMIWSHTEPETIQDKENRIAKWRELFLANEDFTYGVFRGEKLIASTGLHTRVKGNALEIGYWVRADEIKKGIATKVSLALSIIALKLIDIDRIEIHHSKNNIISAKIPEKLRFQRKDNYTLGKKIDNCRWIINKRILNENMTYYKNFYDKLNCFDIKGNSLL